MKEISYLFLALSLFWLGLMVVVAATVPQTQLEPRYVFISMAIIASVVGWASCIAIERENMEAKRRA